MGDTPFTYAVRPWKNAYINIICLQLFSNISIADQIHYSPVVVSFHARDVETAKIINISLIYVCHIFNRTTTIVLNILKWEFVP